MEFNRVQMNSYGAMTLAQTSLFWTLFGVVWATDWRFPPGFKFGAATSSYQVEGAWNADDKSENIWDRHTHEFADRMTDNSTGDVACDSYNKWREDIRIAGELGLHFYRFSLSWSRLLPTGLPDKVSEAGKKYYGDLIDGLLEKGIEPVVTIYHWDLPMRLQNLGGWINPMIVDWFADYAKIVFSLYADRVKTWVTINEPIVMCDASLNTGILAPTFKDPFASYICGKHVMLAHAKAWRIYDEIFKPKYEGRAGITNQLIWFEAESPESEHLIELTRDLAVGLYSHPIFSKEGGWPPALEEHVAKKSKEEGLTRSRLPAFTQEEIDLVKGTYDFYGLNYYTSGVIRKARVGENIGPWPIFGIPELQVVITRRPEWKRCGSFWLYIYPEGMRKQLAWLKQNYGDIEILILENGCSSIDKNLDDTVRTQYYVDHLEQVLLAIREDNINITAYTAWTLMDNFEWNDGYSIKFGLYDVDFEDENRTRTPRASARYYANVIKTHSLDVNKKRNKHSDELYVLCIYFILTPARDFDLE